MKNEASIQRMWEALDENCVPEVKDLHHLSGLIDEDIERFTKAWKTLPIEVRRKLMYALYEMAEMNFEMDFNTIFRMGLKDTDAEVRTYAIEGLWEDEDVRLIPQLIALLQEDENTGVRAAAAKCLAHFILLGELEKIRPRPFETAYEALLRAHKGDNDLEVRRRALEALAYTSHDELKELIEVAYQHPEELMRISAVFAMGRNAEAHWAATVMAELNSPNPEMRYEATRSSGELGLKEAVDTLVELTDDVDIEIQQMALWALGQIGGKVAEKTLNYYVDSDNEALQVAAQEALGELEFLHGNLDIFFGPPAEFDGESDIEWFADDDELDDNELDDLLEEFL